MEKQLYRTSKNWALKALTLKELNKPSSHCRGNHAQLTHELGKLLRIQ
jgi:hypothetical protein